MVTTTDLGMLSAFLDSIVACPDEHEQWLILADWLEDRGDPRAELVRLTWQLQHERQHVQFNDRQARAFRLVSKGLLPLVPERLVPERALHGVTFVWIPPGEFDMGSASAEMFVAQPCHRVTLARGFWMSRTPVTREQWRALMPSRPFPYANGDGQLPVTYATRLECQEFCRRLSGLTFRCVRLPTEAEWEYACRATTVTNYYSGGTAKELHMVGWFRRNAKAIQPVMWKLPNLFGLYDMHGNVAERCQDCYDPYPSCSAGPEADPCARGEGEFYVTRGGSYLYDPLFCASAYRNCISAGDSRADVGLRVVFNDDEAEPTS